MADIQFIGDQGDSGIEVVDIDAPLPLDDDVTLDDRPFPDAIIKMSDETKTRLKVYVEDWLSSLKSAHEDKIDEWAAQEQAYRAISDGPLNFPFVGACGDVVPVIAMSVDPIHARLDTGVFKSSPMIRFKGLKKSALPYIDPLEQWVEYYQKHRLQFRAVAAPRILEMIKHGTMFYKVVYERERYKIKSYNRAWEVVTKDVTTFSGPKVYGISIQDMMFPPGYQHLNDCPFVAERIRTTIGQLRIAQASKKIANVDEIVDQETSTKDTLREERQISANHEDADWITADQIEIFEIWCDFPIDGDDALPDRLVITYHWPTSTILQCRYNWYFHQRKPYIAIPYQITNDSIYGLGICEMSLFFQEAETKWHRMANDNAYLANIRMFIAKRESGIEEVPKLYTGRVFFVDNPGTDFIPFAAADIYQSTLGERQNIFGLAEKRTGISDYLTGRESPIVGSRATATSTVALIQEGTRRVEEVLENIRSGFSEIFRMCIYIWIQYGLDGIDDVVFGDDRIGEAVKDFFDSVSNENVVGMIAVDIAATDAANNKAVQQQTQLAMIQTMMQYLDKLVQAGQMAISAAQQQPELTALVSAVMESSRKMFTDLLNTYNVRNPEDYLPDLQRFLDAAVSAGQAQSGAPPGVGGPPNGGGGPVPGAAGGGPLGAGGAPSGPGIPPVPGTPTNPAAQFAARVGVGDPGSPIPTLAG